MKQNRREVRQWEAGLNRLHARVGRHFRRREPRLRVRSYAEALLGGVDRKNSWQLAEHAGEKTPYGMQRLIASARWDAVSVRDELRDYAVEHLEDEDAVLVRCIGSRAWSLPQLRTCASAVELHERASRVR